MGLVRMSSAKVDVEFVFSVKALKLLRFLILAFLSWDWKYYSPSVMTGNVLTLFFWLSLIIGNYIYIKPLDNSYTYTVDIWLHRSKQVRQFRGFDIKTISYPINFFYIPQTKLFEGKSWVFSSWVTLIFSMIRHIKKSLRLVKEIINLAILLLSIPLTEST